MNCLVWRVTPFSDNFVCSIEDDFSFDNPLRLHGFEEGIVWLGDHTESESEVGRMKLPDSCEPFVAPPVGITLCL